MHAVMYVYIMNILYVPNILQVEYGMDSTAYRVLHIQYCIYSTAHTVQYVQYLIFIYCIVL